MLRSMDTELKYGCARFQVCQHLRQSHPELAEALVRVIF